ncbi:hypothetical protein GJ496_009073 [Pomphorhynchus laevis]|nr:hypothetical protein GJ496_009073 [Pomphorhynchus laevis]
MSFTVIIKGGNQKDTGRNHSIYIDCMQKCDQRLPQCQYKCMWRTVDILLEQNKPIPQFGGRWPFIQLFNLQEPASFLFSMLNLFATVHCLHNFYHNWNVHISRSDMFWPYMYFYKVATNAWFWSTVFHAYDFPFSEKMDYLSAALLVFYHVLLCTYRILIIRMRTFIIPFRTFSLLGILTYACWILLFPIDYDTNMLVISCIAGANIISWSIWSILNWKIHRKLSIKCLIAILSVAAVSPLELFDFPPLFFIFDAHSLWHLGTIVFPYLWLEFIIEDCLYY